MLQKVQSNSVACFHCGLPTASGEQFCAEFDGQQRSFCCPACRAVATTIIDSGLSSFYQFRSLDGQLPASVSEQDVFKAYDDDEFRQRYIFTEQVNGHTIAHTQLLVGNIHCAACTWLLEKYLSSLPGMEQVAVSLTEQKASLRWRIDELALSEICAAITNLGYQPEPYTPNHLQDLQQRENHQALRRLGVAGIGMMQVGMFAIALHAGALQSMEPEFRELMRWVSFLVTTPVLLYSAQPFFIGAWRGLKLNKPGMDVPVAIALGLAYFASVKATLLSTGDVYFDSVTMFTFLLLGGRYLEMRARHVAGRLGSDLSSLLPATALRLRSSAEFESVPLFKVKVGDQLLVKPGQIIPADGVVIAGVSGVDESQMTGEFRYQNKQLNDQVIAGTINGSGVLTIAVQSTGADLQLQSINQLLITAQAEKPQIAEFADRFASYFVVTVLALAAATYIYWAWFATGQNIPSPFWVMLSVLVVSCPCALSLATPAALTAATNRLRVLGLLVTRAHVWERMADITDVVCDKTGTLTKGELSISEIIPVSDLSAHQCLKLAAAIESYSEHPIARAFTVAVESQNQADDSKTEADNHLAIEQVEVSTGAGIAASINGTRYHLGSSAFAAELYRGEADQSVIDNQGQWVLLSDTSGALCWFQLEDSLREDADLLVRTLQSKGLILHLLSGDSSGAAQTLSDQLGMNHCAAGATPQDKLDYIADLQRNGAKVLMLGDGVNDVPVLAAADISVAMANASNLAKTHADSFLLSGRLTGVLTLMDMAVSTRKIIRQNLAWALAYNFSAIPLAAAGLIAPYLAAVGMSLSSLVVVFNALRLQRSKAGDYQQSIKPLAALGAK